MYTYFRESLGCQRLRYNAPPPPTPPPPPQKMVLMYVGLSTPKKTVSDVLYGQRFLSYRLIFIQTPTKWSTARVILNILRRKPPVHPLHHSPNLCFSKTSRYCVTRLPKFSNTPNDPRMNLNTWTTPAYETKSLAAVFYDSTFWRQGYHEKQMHGMI